jgi:hypothetical protein
MKELAVKCYRTGLAFRLLVVILVSSVGAAAQAQPRYDFVLIDSFNANPLAGEAYVWGLNDLGLAVGVATVDNVMGYPGMVWDEAAGRRRIAVASPRTANVHGLVVGIGDVLDLNSGQMFTPPNLPGTYYSPSFGDVNDAGVAVGTISGCTCSDSGGVLQVPYIWDAVNGARSISVPNARGLSRINEGGVAIGWLNGWVLNDGFFVDIESGAYSYLTDVLPAGVGTGIVRATDINDSGEIVCSRAGTYPVHRYGFVYSPGSGTTILPFPGAGYQQYVNPLAINNAGTVVGTISTEFASQRVFVYSATDGLIDLNDGALIAGMPAGYRLYAPTDINNAGWIAGYGQTAANKITGFVLKVRGTTAGDVDGDGDVDLGDLSLLLVSFGLCSDDPGFNAGADFDASGCVELSDLAVLLANFGT